MFSFYYNLLHNWIEGGGWCGNCDIVWHQGGMGDKKISEFCMTHFLMTPKYWILQKKSCIRCCSCSNFFQSFQLHWIIHRYKKLVSTFIIGSFGYYLFCNFNSQIMFFIRRPVYFKNSDNFSDFDSVCSFE